MCAFCHLVACVCMCISQVDFFGMRVGGYLHLVVPGFTPGCTQESFLARVEELVVLRSNLDQPWAREVPYSLYSGLR